MNVNNIRHTQCCLPFTLRVLLRYASSIVRSSVCLKTVRVQVQYVRFAQFTDAI